MQSYAPAQGSITLSAETRDAGPKAGHEVLQDLLIQAKNTTVTVHYGCLPKLRQPELSVPLPSRLKFLAVYLPTSLNPHHTSKTRVQAVSPLHGRTGTAPE